MTCLLVTLAQILPAGAAITERLCSFTDPRIDESSGVAAASIDRHHVWTHNDSGDTARRFLVDTLTCATDATYLVDLGGANPIDWEDIVRGELRDGTPTLLIGDIGDNGQTRSSVAVYEVVEPSGLLPEGVLPTDEQPLALRAKHTVVYPTGPRDAETLLFVRQTRQLAIVTKPRDAAGTFTGLSEVYGSPGRLSSRTGTVTMTKLADIDFNALPRSKPEQLRSIAATAGTVTRDSRFVAVRTYVDLWEWAIPTSGDLTEAFAAAPRKVALSETQQGEGAAYTRDGKTIWTTSEGDSSRTPPGSVVDRYRMR